MSLPLLAVGGCCWAGCNAWLTLLLLALQRFKQFLAVCLFNFVGLLYGFGGLCCRKVFESLIFSGVGNKTGLKIK